MMKMKREKRSALTSSIFFAGLILCVAYTLSRAEQGSVVAAAAEEAHECELVPSQWMLQGEALCGVDPGSGNTRLSLSPAASAFQGRRQHFLDEGR